MFNKIEGDLQIVLVQIEKHYTFLLIWPVMIIIFLVM